MCSSPSERVARVSSSLASGISPRIIFFRSNETCRLSALHPVVKAYPGLLLGRMLNDAILHLSGQPQLVSSDGINELHLSC